MRLAYLVTTYPHISHSFVRREITALEAQGASVSRFSIRTSSAELADAADRDERGKTRVILNAGVFGLLIAVFKLTLLHPRCFSRSLVLAVRLARQSHRGVLRHLGYLAEACRLLGWLKRDDIQHLHTHFAGNSAAVAMLCHELGGPPYSFTAHGIDAFDAPAAISLGEKVKRASFVVAVCNYGRGQIWRWSAPSDWGKVHVVRCGVDQGFLAHPRVPIPTDPRLVVVARFGPEKGHLVLLDAATQLVNANVQFELVLVGDGPMRAQIETSIQHLGLQRQVRLVGWKSGAEVRDEILASRTVVLPSFAEGLPVVLMEALALGRPVISTYIAGIPELVIPGVNGWLVPVASAELLANAMHEVLSADPAKLTAMGAAGADRVLKNHNAKLEAAKLFELFGAAIASEKVQSAPLLMAPTTAAVAQRPVS